MSDGVATRLGHDVVNVEGAREMVGHVDSCLRRNDGRGRTYDQEGASMTGPAACARRRERGGCTRDGRSRGFLPAQE